MASTLAHATLPHALQPEARLNSPSDLCPEPDFREALALVLAHLPGAINSVAGGEDAVVRQFRGLGPSPRCLATPSSEWPASRRSGTGLITDLGAGTTGTKYATCVFRELGYRGGHYVGLQGAHTTSTFDAYDFVADYPVEARLAEILATHTGHADGGGLLSLRDPVEWAQARLSKHLSEGSASWGVTGPCGGDGHVKLSANASTLALHKLTYDAFAACLGSSARLGRSRADLFVFNLFEGADDDNRAFADRLAAFLMRDGKSARLADGRRREVRPEERAEEAAAVRAAAAACHSGAMRHMNKHAD